MQHLIIQSAAPFEHPEPMDSLPRSGRGLHDLADSRDSRLSPSIDKLVGRRDPHRQVRMAEIGDQLVDGRLGPIDRRRRRCGFRLGIRAAIDDPPDPAARRGRGRDGSAALHNGR